MTSDTVKELSIIKMEINFEANSNLIKHVGKVFTTGKAESYMMENGLTVSKTAMEYGKVCTEIATSENGAKKTLMVTVSILGQTATGTKVNGICV